ncbi:hypothetical protein M8J75_012939 [Diaphorina citri]|nr:hypothetical protein M8J75_012939 [Diaphorina citri]
MATWHSFGLFLGYPRNVRRYLKTFITLCLVLLIIYLIPTPRKHYNDPQMFDKFNNETGMDYAIIPNIVHYVIFNNQTIDFVSFLSIVSAIKFQKPDLIMIHSNLGDLSGYYWDILHSLLSVTNSTIHFQQTPIPTHVFGQKLSSIYHASDVTRINVLMKYGGIYLDTDSIVLKSLKKFLHFEMVLGWPERKDMGSQILIAHKNARFLRLWLNGYRIYKSSIWYYNAGQYPTEQILHFRPDLVHRIKTKLGVHNLLTKLHEDPEWAEWREYYAIHLLARHYPGVEEVNEVSVMTSKTPYAQIIRYVLYETAPYFDLHNVVLKRNRHHWVFKKT